MKGAFSRQPESNHIDFIVWHMARVEDTLFNRAILRREDLWEREGWGEKLGIAAEGNGYRFNAEQATDLPDFTLDDLMEYYRSVRGEIVEYIDSLTEDDLDNFPIRGVPNIRWEIRSNTSWSKKPSMWGRLPTSGACSAVLRVERNAPRPSPHL